IPGGSLAEALNTFGVQSGIGVGYDIGTVRGLTTPGLSGTFSDQEALSRLLAGTNLVPRQTALGSVLIESPQEISLGLETDSDDVLLDPVVLGERRPRTLAETTTSVRVFSEAEIDQTDSTGVLDAIRNTANLTPATSDFLPPIRGTASAGPADLGGLALFGTLPRAALIIDDVAQPSTEANNSFQSAFDIEQIEVLRGPQTTLRGANAISGAFVVKTKDPVFRREAEVESGFDWNEFGQFSFRAGAVVNSPIVEDQIAARLVFEFEERNAPLDIISPTLDNQITFGAFPPPPGSILDDFGKGETFRLRTKFLFEPNAIPDFSAIVSVEYQEGRAVGFDTSIFGDDPGGAFTAEDRIGFPSFQRILDTDVVTVSGNAEYQLNDVFELQSITSYTFDFFEEAPDDIEFFNFAGTTQKRFNQDLLLKFDGFQGFVNGLVGFSAFIENLDQDLDDPFEFDTLSERFTLSWFTDLELEVTDRIDILLGGRVQRESRDFFVEGTGFGGPLLTLEDKTTEIVFLPKVGAVYEFNEDHSISAVARRGFNSGGAGVDLLTGLPFSFESEFVWTIETGYRGTLFDDRLTLSATGFYNIYDDFQFLSAEPLNLVITNFDGDTFGLELEATAQVTDDIIVRAGLGLLQTDIDAPGEVVDGNDFGTDPTATLNGAIIWSPIPELKMNVQAQYVAGSFADFNNFEGQMSEGYFNVDLGASYEYGEHIQVRGFVRNVFDDLQFFQQLSALRDGEVLAPRTFGMTVKAKF
ncbi:MAG: TonB-dependent receptor, partial [Pseudomonadota bacterium]